MKSLNCNADFYMLNTRFSTGSCRKINFTGDQQSSFGSLTNHSGMWVFFSLIDDFLENHLSFWISFWSVVHLQILTEQQIHRISHASRWASTDWAVGDPHCLLLQLTLYVPSILSQLMLYDLNLIHRV